MNKQPEQRKPHWDLIDKKAQESNTIDLEAYALGVEDGIKWTQERSFSEEEVLRIIKECKSYLSFFDEFNEVKWFDNFKK